MEKLRFLTPALVESIGHSFGTPTYVYDASTLEAQARAALAFPNAYGLTVRYAMKAAPNKAILSLFHRLGLHIDASSGYEVKRALLAGIPGDHISLSTQEFPQDFENLHREGIRFNACSIEQLRRFAETFPGESLGLRFNPGLGSGGTAKTNVGGPSSSFGIWHESIDQVKAIVEKHQLNVIRIHTHIGSGSDPKVWQKTASMSLDLVRAFPNVHTLNLGGGYKVGRMSGEASTDLQVIGEPVREAFESLAKETGRELMLEIEPGTFLVANACALVSKVQDLTETGSEGHCFIKLDTGMTEVLRPSLYGAQHPIIIVPNEAKSSTQQYVVSGHCCESGDLLTSAPDQPEVLAPRELLEASLGDYCVIEGVGAYCSSMSTINYNSFPQAAEVMIYNDEPKLIRTRQKLEQVLQNEVSLNFDEPE